jgi:hypothetical protein
MGKTEYFNIIERYFVCGNKKSKRFKNDKGMIETLTRDAI